MKYYEVTAFTTEAGLEAVSARFNMLGLEQQVIVQGKEEIADFLNKTAQYWDFADMDELCAHEPCVQAYLPQEETAQERLDGIRASFEELKNMELGMDLGSLSVIVRIVDDSEWLEAWKAVYKPFPVGSRLLVRPSWEEASEPGRRVLALDPGMAFGTGTHQTTRMCLEYVDQWAKEGDAALDLGCGSGILSIAALLLGAKNALAVDIDPIAENIAYENAALNGIGKDRYAVLIGDVLTDRALQQRISVGRYELITANIVASVIVRLAPFAAGLLAPGGRFIASGIISARLDEVLAALQAAGMAVLEVNSDGDWRAILATNQA